MSAECQRMPDHSTTVSVQQMLIQNKKNKKALDNHIWWDHQKKTYTKWKMKTLRIYCLSLTQLEETYNGGA